MSGDPRVGKRIRWTNEAIVVLASLSAADRQTLVERLELVAQFPAMYPARQRGRFTGLRYFVVRRRWVAYYRPEGDVVLIITMVPALARPR